MPRIYRVHAEVNMQQTSLFNKQSAQLYNVATLTKPGGNMFGDPQTGLCEFLRVRGHRGKHVSTVGCT
ncbi:hypothetical protein MAR_014362 [Mya arenaria]|uniref:Uncharacterized protein n=1 Tax=Mya arenaria TaxID=6604 RepID=A0ABY7G670_MYAAR|nr:hypothetical protein MAR_014362 [Mya arenaria]